MGAIFAGSIESFPTKYGSQLRGRGPYHSAFPRPKPKPSTHQVPIGDPTEEAYARWIQAQIQYENLADNRDIQERARGFVVNQKHWFESRTHEIRDLWQALDFLLRGNSLTRRFPDSDIHIPELYKMVETLVPRIEEALLQQDPWFTVHGRDRMDRFQEKSIGYWLDYLLDLSRFADKLQPGIRAMIVYGFMAYKVWWDVEYREQITRDVEKLEGRNVPTYKITPKSEKIPVYEGPRLQLIDPYNWFVDLKAADHQKGTFCGDVRLMTMEEIQRLEDIGLYKNAAELYEQEPIKGTYGTSRWAKIARKLDSAEELFDHKRAPGQPKEFEVSEFWAFWSPVENEPAREFVLTVANEKTVLRVQENFHDDKHRPYAVGRAQNNPFDWRNVGVLDMALRLQLELDDHENLADRSAANRQCPVTFVGPNFDGPRNIFHVDPGEILRTNVPPTFLVPPGTYQDYMVFKEDKRREIEETVGAPRIYEGTSSGDQTATGIERKIQESNRRIRGLVRATTDCCEQILSQYHQLSTQFVMRNKVFRVIGRKAKRIGSYAEISPIDLADPVDFEFKGIEGLSQLGLRGTQMATFMNVVAPLLPALGNDLNVPAMVRTIYESMVGQTLSDDVLREPEALEDLMPPDEENVALAAGAHIGLHPLDDHELHIISHQEALDTWDLDSEGMARLHMHLAHHKMAYKRQLLQQQAMGQSLPMTDQPQQIGGEQPVGGRGLNGRQPDLMTPFQAQQTPPGELPGPPNGRQMGSPDRNTPLPQTANRY